MQQLLAMAAIGLMAITGGGGAATELEGTWRITAMERNGEKAKLAEGKGKGAEFIVKGNHYTVRINGEAVEEGTFKADATKKPRAVEFTVTSGEDKGRQFHGIYEVEGDTLRAIVAPSGKEQPNDFTSGPGTRFITAKRQKAE